MKTNLLVIICLSFALFLGGCNQNSPDPTKGFSSQIQQIVPLALLDTLRHKGMVINEGQAPPNLEGVFQESPVVLVAQAYPDDFPIGHQFRDYRYRFYDQNAQTGAINVDYKSLPEGEFSDYSVGHGGYVAGNGGLFTVFAESKGVSKNIPYVVLEVISGEMTQGGIRNMQHALIMKSKEGDVKDIEILGVGMGRVFKDADGFSERVSKYRVAEKGAKTNNSLLLESNHR